MKSTPSGPTTWPKKKKKNLNSTVKHRKKHEQSTPDNSNLLGKSKIVRVIGSLKQITGSKEISKWRGGGGGCN